jgi:hypothetical protein
MSNPNPLFEASHTTRDSAVRGAILKELERRQSQVERRVRREIFALCERFPIY